MTDDDREALTAYLDGELDDETEQALETRLSQDPNLRAELDALRQTWGLLDYLPKPAASSDFTHRTLDRLSLEGRSTQSASIRRGWPVRRIAVWTVAALLALFVGVAASSGYRRYVEPPIDPDEAIVRRLRLLERLPQFETVEDIEFLKALDTPELFGGDEDS